MRVYQISDLHLFADPEQMLKGFKPDLGLKNVLSKVESLMQAEDILLLSGDLVDEADPVAYERLLQALKKFGRVAFLPGNHDSPRLMKQIFENDNWAHAPGMLSLDDWILVLLDSTIAGQIPGRLDEVQWQYLENAAQIAQDEDKSLMVFLHHHPIPTQGFMDRYILQAHARVRHRLADVPRLKAVCFGHIHQELDQEEEGVRYLAAPSTCYQLKPMTEEHCIEEIPPGFRCFELERDKFTTWIERA